MWALRAASCGLLLITVISCNRNPGTSTPVGDGEGTCLTFSSEESSAWSACLPDPTSFVPEALQRMGLERCEEAWDRLDGDSRATLLESGRIHVDRRCRFVAGPGTAGAAALISLGRTVDLNLATLDDLQVLPGVGPALAERILASHHTDGPFCSVDALTRVKGIGPKTLESLKPYLTATCD